MRPLFLLLSAAVLLCSTSCLRTSTVVRVKKDGTGTITSRYHFSPEMLAMMEQLSKLGDALGGAQGGQVNAGGPDVALLQDLAKPDEASLKEDAAGFGEGVRYAKHEAGKDDDGWEGYTVVYEFDDIRKVRIDQQSMPGKAKEFAKSAGEDAKPAETGSITFDLKDDVLTIKSDFAKSGMGDVVNQDQFDQAKQMGMKPSDSIKMAAGMTKDMRVGYFVRIDGGIAETNATHVTGDLITLSDADISKVLMDPDLGPFIDKVAADPKAVTPEQQKELLGKLEAMTIETKEEVTVKLK
jgi:hypothetical protein